MVKEWFTASEVSKLPHLPNNARNIRSKAEMENWEKRKCAVGKGYEYHINFLPQEIQQHLAKQAAETLVKTNIAPVLSARQLASELTRQDDVKANLKQQYREKNLAAFNGLSNIS